MKFSEAQYYAEEKFCKEHPLCYAKADCPLETVCVGNNKKNWKEEFTAAIEHIIEQNGDTYTKFVE